MAGSAEELAETAATELLQQVADVDSEAIEEAAVTVGVDLIGQLAVGLLDLVVVARERSRWRIWDLSMFMEFSWMGFGRGADSAEGDLGHLDEVALLIELFGALVGVERAYRAVPAGGSVCRRN